MSPATPGTDLETGPGGGADPRVYLAAERTLLAWIRTGLAMMGLGFLVAKFGLFVREMAAWRGTDVADPPRLSVWIGTMLVLLGIAATLLAAVEYVCMLRRLGLVHQVGAVRFAMSAGIAVVMGVTGLVMAVYLLFL
ncbi:MAG: DUF202 domain-containing protein [Pirellulaceae bacterium]|jgi:putative membrane protein|nr:DUF202 domain-containing protein [Pirellulaceae bacterium]